MPQSVNFCIILFIILKGFASQVRKGATRMPQMYRALAICDHFSCQLILLSRGDEPSHLAPALEDIYFATRQ